jgi:hypothetical protein
VEIASWLRLAAFAPLPDVLRDYLMVLAAGVKKANVNSTQKGTVLGI